MAVVKINAIEIPEGQGAELEKRFAGRHGTVEDAPGFLHFELLRPVQGDNRYFVYTRWETEQDYQNWANGPAKDAHANSDRKPVATGANLLEFEVVQQTSSD